MKLVHPTSLITVPIFAILAAALFFAPQSAFAWDFSCSPETVTEIEPELPPSVLLMLDRSGSMDWDPRPRTCRVCESPEGAQYEVDGPADCGPVVPEWEVVQRRNEPTNSSVSGYAHVHTISGYPTPAPGVDPVIDFSLFGDFNGGCEYADIWVNNTVGSGWEYIGRFNPNSGQCSEEHTATITAPEWLYSSGTFQVRFETSPDGNSCGSDGVDAFCGSQYTQVTFAQRSAKYLGTIESGLACGTENKWEQALSAIDRVTKESSSVDPNLAHFGMGHYRGDSDISIDVDCAANTHVPIMDRLNDLSPTGATPTARAVYESANSACIQNALFSVVEQSATEPTNSSTTGYDLNYSFTGLPSQTSDFEIEVDVFGDFDGTCEFADIYADGVYLGRHNPSGSQCNSNPHTARFTAPASLLDDGELKVVIDTRSRDDATTGPSCSAGQHGVEAFCGTNRGVVRVKLKPKVSQAAATILINDGEPTRSFGGRDAFHATIHEACEHRKVANLYVVGLGTGTDQDFNNVQAAAGGTGRCEIGGVEVDPCDDPSKWKDYYGHCTGAFETDGSDALLNAISAITGELQCIFDVDFSGAPTTSVPADPTNEYPYLYVGGFSSGVGESNVFHKDAPLAVPPGEGWDFTSANRSRVKFTDFYCNQVRARDITRVTTQLACLCEQTPGDPCIVPDADALGVCETGTWSCVEGKDICVPDDSCCVPGADCNTGDLGICADGEIQCIDDVEVCVPLNTPGDEVCNGLDDDCDGIVDNIDPVDCTVPDAQGRCSIGQTSCVAGSDACVPIFGPMPEVCNGIDDDCDGIVDNISESWEKSQFSGLSLPPDKEPIACNFANTCMCPDGPAEPAGVTFDEFVNAWDGTCMCGSGLEAGESSSVSGPSSPEQSSASSAGCSATGSPSDAAALFAMLLGIGFMTRRR